MPVDPRLLYLALALQQSQHRHNMQSDRGMARHAAMLRLARTMGPEQMADIRAAMNAADLARKEPTP